MGEVFSKSAAFYDLLYQDKDYKGEADYLAALIRRFAPRKKAKTSILDLACGTGRHLFELAKMGFAVEGSDASADMIEQARASAAKLGLQIKLHSLPFQRANEIDGKFDALILVFSAIDYLTKPDDLSLALNNFAGLLSPHGALIFDFWNGNAVVRDFQPLKTLEKTAGSRKIRRVSETSIDQSNNLATVKFKCLYLENDEEKAEFEELHVVRYFYLEEMKELLRSHGFETEYVSPFMELDKPLNPFDWNVSICARLRSF